MFLETTDPVPHFSFQLIHPIQIHSDHLVYETLDGLNLVVRVSSRSKYVMCESTKLPVLDFLFIFSSNTVATSFSVMFLKNPASFIEPAMCFSLLRVVTFRRT